MPNPSDSSSEYSSDSEEEVLSDNIDIESNDGNHSNEDNNNEDRDNEDNNNDDEEHNDDDDGETSKEKLTTSDVWEFVDKAARKCPSCGKIFKSQRELALFVLIYKIMEYYLLKQNRPHWIILLNDILKKFN